MLHIPHNFLGMMSQQPNKQVIIHGNPQFSGNVGCLQPQRIEGRKDSVTAMLVSLPRCLNVGESHLDFVFHPPASRRGALPHAHL